MDEYSAFPLHLLLLQHLLDEVAPKWCEHNLPPLALQHIDKLMRVMEIALEFSEQDQHLRVKQVLLRDLAKVQAALESWLVDIGLTIYQRYQTLALSLMVCSCG